MATILIVDDEKNNRELLRIALADLNPDWDILLASDELEAISIMRERIRINASVDVVLTDLVMTEEQSGMLLLREARELDPSVMTILFTAKEKSLDRYEAFNYGAFDVVEKNIRGANASREINLKARAALRYREWFSRLSFLKRYFDPQVFSVFEQDPGLLELRERLVTVCFWDIRGFSALCETLRAQPDLVAGFLRDFSDEAAKTVFRNRGVLDKFLGDGVMALFGVLSEGEIASDGDPFCAVQAAIELRRTFDVVREKWAEQWRLYSPATIEIGLGCGIHTGQALVGNVGTEFRDQFTALGSTVNLAARLQTQATGGEIIVSQTTMERLKNDVVFERMPDASDIKNIAGKFSLYRATGIMSHPG